jgi:ribosomal protein L18
MLVALGDKPVRRARTVTTPASTTTPAMQRLAQPPTQGAKTEVTPFAPTTARAQTVQAERVKTSASVQPDPAQRVQGSPQTGATQDDADLASELIASGVTTQPVETVIAVLSSHRRGASINAAAKASGINFRTAQRIVAASQERQQDALLAVG